jgi:hypothetical protein
MGFIEAGVRILDFTDYLPMLERTAFYIGASSFMIGAIETETANPFWGGVHVVLGLTCLMSSTVSQEAIEALDNRGKV